MARNVLPLAAAALALFGCTSLIGERGSGDVITETRDVSDFTGVDLSGEGHVTVVIGEEFGLVISAEDNIMPLLTSEVSGETLILGASESINPSEEISYEVTMPLVTLLRVSGSGQIDATGVVGDTLGVEVSGSGAVDIDDLSLTAMETNISGSGHVVVAGEADHLEVSISGSGALEAENLTAQTGAVDVSGSGSVVVDVVQELEVDVSGSGSVEYVGDPPLLDVDVSGSGNVSGR